MDGAVSSPVRKEEPFFERLKLMRNCPVCNTAYTGSEGHIVEEYRGSSLVHLTCRSCRSALLALVVISGSGMSSVYMMTDLSVVDTVHLRAAAPIGEDDVLALHTLLQKPLAFEERITGQ